MHPTHRAPPLALAALLLASLTFLPSPAVANSCRSVYTNGPNECPGYTCDGNEPPMVAAVAPTGVRVQGRATCGSATASCQAKAACTGYGATDGTAGPGTCSGSSYSYGILVCSSGRNPDDVLAALLDIVTGPPECKAATYAARGLAALTVILMPAGPAAPASAFAWSPAGGCVSVAVQCELGPWEEPMGIHGTLIYGANCHTGITWEQPL
jgi:hypothetical protein